MKKVFFPFLLCFIVAGILISSPSSKRIVQIPSPADTISSIDSQINVKGKKVLFIGDSHTANHSYGWQKVLCDKTGMVMKNTSVGGKNTYWMLNMAVYTANKSFDYCFIYGGANDMYSNTSMIDAVYNIKGIIRICKGNGITPVVMTGFSPELCVDRNNYSVYISRYSKFQKMLLDSIKDARVIKSHFVSRKDGDCGDHICHMTAKGHRKMGEGVIREMKFKVIK